MDVVPVCDSDRVGGALLVGDVHPGRREVAHEHHGERRDDPGARLEARDCRAHVVQGLLGYDFAVEDQAATRSRRIELAAPEDGTAAPPPGRYASQALTIQKPIRI